MVLSIATKIVLNFVDFSILVSRLFGRGARIFLRKSSKFELLNRFVSLNHFKPFESIQMDTKTLSVQILNVQIKTKPSLCFQFFSFDHSKLLLIRKVKKSLKVATGLRLLLVLFQSMRTIGLLKGFLSKNEGQLVAHTIHKVSNLSIFKI